jgi:hypothetical protein
MKAILFSVLLIALIGCKQTGRQFEIKIYEFSGIKELLIYNIIGDPEFKLSPAPSINFTNYLTWDKNKFINMNWKEIQSTFSINDSVQVTNDLTLVFFTYSVKSDIIRDVEWVRKINNKYFTTTLYLSPYSKASDFKNIDDATFASLEAKIEKWQESSSDVWWK